MADVAATLQPQLVAPRSSWWRRADLDVWIPGAVLILLVGACFLGPYISHLPSPNATDLSHTRLPVGSPGHLLGTDDLGRDLLSRSLYGGRTSLEVGVLSVLLGLVVGVSLGVVAGFVRGLVDAAVMRVLDVFLAFPSLVLVLVVATYLGPSERNVIFAIGFFTVPTYARVARAGMLQLRDREFVLSSSLAGGGPRYLVARHILPNMAGRLMTYGLLSVGVAMIVEAALSFLGLGVRPPTASWGAMIAEGQSYLTSAPQIALVPGVFLFVAVAALNMLGDGLRTRSDGGGRRP